MTNTLDCSGDITFFNLKTKIALSFVEKVKNVEVNLVKKLKIIETGKFEMNTCFCPNSKKDHTSVTVTNTEGNPSIFRGTIRKCKRLFNDMLLGTITGTAVGAAVGGVIVYFYWKEVNRISDSMHVAQKFKEDLIEHDPSAQLMANAPLSTLIAEKDRNYKLLISCAQLAPLIGAGVGFCVGSVVGLLRLCRNIVHLT